ncbi:glycosyltransferase involved in cell wall biosynthesis [Fusobacterium sp. PH5-7]|uniref:glycosyltransferase n=1 Tax=Fusobacterium sp. PH5-7 TaxID=2940528 RepID=UPI002473D1B0|nr:glycosyltransferase [Fusobacterium sp. PH5-7]MDH6456545.1 glycosyltransferase involved in cell wall biosynthesis [Fusobacterium sp. PH5-7]
MKKILFKVKGLGIGGIERLAIDILNNLKIENKKIVLLIENKEEDFLENQLDKSIEKVYLKPDWFNPFLLKIKLKKKNIFYKLLYNILMNYEKRILSNSINNYIKNNKEAEIFIDYNGEAGKYIQKIKVSRKIMWNHLSIANKKGKKLEKYGKRLNRYDEIIAICEEMREELIFEFPYLREKIKRIYNFIDLEKIKEKLSENNISEEEKKMMNENYCVSVGRLAEPKDYETTIEAFNLLKKKGIKEKLYILGDGIKKEKLQNMIEEKNLSDQVFLLGIKSNPYIWMENADIFIHSSKLEGFVMVLLEAMACNVPIVCSICKTGVKEILNYNVGEGFKIGRTEELTAKIESLLKDSSKKRIYIKNSKIVVNKFSKEKILKEYKKLIENL